MESGPVVTFKIFGTTTEICCDTNKVCALIKKANNQFFIQLLSGEEYRVSEEDWLNVHKILH